MTKQLVLVVDDNPDWRHDFEAYTRHFGFDVVTAENGAEAIAVIEANPAIVAVVTDTQMYPGDGITVLQFVGGRHTLLPTLILSSAPRTMTFAPGDSTAKAFCHPGRFLLT